MLGSQWPQLSATCQPPPTPGTSMKSLKSAMQFCFFYDSSKTAVSATEEQLNTKHECQECHFVKRPKIIVPVSIILVTVTLPIMVVRK